MRLDREQRSIARSIVLRGLRRHAKRREVLANLETGIVESNLRNLPGGSGSSVGYRQETKESYPNVNRRNVAAAIDRFYAEARAKRGVRGKAGVLAQAVQRSAYPDRYEAHRGEAESILRSVDPSDGSGGDSGGQGSLSVLLRQNGQQEPVQPADLTAVNLLAQSLERPAPPPLGAIAPPAFSAKAPMPQNAPVLPSAGSPAPQGPSLDDQLQAVSQITGQVPAQPEQSLSAIVRSGGEAPVENGKVKVAGSANRAGVGIKPVVMDYLSHVAGRAHKAITVGTGTNHNRLTVNGNVSDHWDGHAADLPVPDDSHQGDVIATAALEQAGVPRSRARAMARRGGLFTINHSGRRIQVIWKTNDGGNHHNHVHIGIR